MRIRNLEELNTLDKIENYLGVGLNTVLSALKDGVYSPLYNTYYPYVQLRFDNGKFKLIATTDGIDGYEMFLVSDYDDTWRLQTIPNWDLK